MRLTDRDKILLQALHDYEMMSTSQLLRKCFPGILKTTALRRLRIVENAKLIRRVSGHSSGEFIWMLTPFGAHTIHQEHALVTINKNTLDHDVMLTEIRLSLEESQIARGWKTEQQLRRANGNLARNQKGWSAKPQDGDRVPDGLFALKPKEGKQRVVAFELELSLKNSKRYQRLFAHYICRKQIWGIWYAVPHPRYGARILKEWNKASPRRDSPLFGWVELEAISDLSQPLVLNTLREKYLIREAQKTAHPHAQEVGTQHA